MLGAVNDVRSEAMRREAEAWSTFEAAVLRIPRDRWGEEGVLPGWAVRDLLWHVAGWMDRCAENLERRGDGALDPVEETDEQVDALNEAFAAAARMMDSDAVWSGLVAARDLARRRLGELPDVDDTAIGWFGGETFEHYGEHLGDLERFAG